MEAQQLFRVLLAAGTESHADQAVNLLRRNGLTLLARDINHKQGLPDQLAAERWHLILAYADNPVMPAAQILRHLRETRQDIPCLAVAREREEIPELLKLGAAAVFLQDELDDGIMQKRFVHAARNELKELQVRRENRRLASDMKELEARYQSLLATTNDAVACLQDGIHLYCNDAYAAYFGLDADALTHKPFLDLIDDSDVENVRTFLRDETKVRSSTRCSFLALRHDGGSVRSVMTVDEVHFHGDRCLQVRVEPETGNVARANLRQGVAETDIVTGLPDRRAILGIIEQRISDAIHSGQSSTLIVVELEPFADLVAIMRKADRNQLLADIAKLLKDTCPAEARIGRLGDNSFAIVIPGSGKQLHRDMLGELGDIDSAISKLLPPQAELSSSAGVTIITEEAPDAGTLIVRAQHNRVLRLHKRVELGTAEENDRTLKKLETALAEDALQAVYQPTISLQEDGRERYEMRIRIPDGDTDVLHPPTFLEIASQHGLGEKIDRVMLGKAMALLRDSGNKRLSLTVNLTQNSVTSRELLPWLAAKLHAARLSPEQLVLQISEIDLVSAPEDVAHFCDQMQKLDLAISINHFGCAVEPFRYLKQVAAHYAKLDRSLLMDIDKDVGNRERLQSLVSGLHAQGILVVAPMIERMEILPLLWQAKVNFVQGNGLQAPSDSMDFSFVRDEEITLKSL